MAASEGIWNNIKITKAINRDRIYITLCRGNKWMVKRTKMYIENENIENHNDSESPQLWI